MGNPRAFLTIPRKEAGYRPIEDRVHDYGEVEQTLAAPERTLQASRCMDCGVPFCHWACPLHNRMPEYQDLLSKGKWKEAYQVLSLTHPFPEFTGRICPALCEKSCVQALFHESVTVRENECATAERAFSEGYVTPRIPKRHTGKRVAVIGGGPAGMAAADRLCQLGHTVTVYEKNEAIGGLLRFGIPDFKLSKHVIDRRLAILEAEGITFKTNTIVGDKPEQAIEGKTYVTPEEIDRQYEAVVLTMGAETPRDLKVENRELSGVYFALQLLQQQNRVCRGEEIPEGERITAKGKDVLVIGGGDTGSDCVGTANRQGARSVTQIEVMPKPFEDDDPTNPWPAYPRLLLKTTSSHKEGCHREWSLNTLRFVTDEAGRLAGAEVERVEWKTPAGGGRPSMVATGEKKVIACQLVLLAMGFTQPVAAFVDAWNLEKDARGNIQTADNGQTSNPKVFAAGDCHTGASLVVRALAAGRTVADNVDAYLA